MRDKGSKDNLEDVSPEKALEIVLDNFTHNESALLKRFQEDKSNELTKKEMLRIAEDKFLMFRANKEERVQLLKEFEKFIWGYYVLDELIKDLSISDIKCYSWNHVRIKKYGERLDSNISFKSENDYRRFVGMVATKNEVNISAINAIQSFTDDASSDDFSLRCDICTDYVNTKKTPCLQIRKFPKFKYTLDELIEKKNFMSPEQKKYLEEKAIEASGMLFIGKGSAGKSTLLNTMLDLIPHNRSGLVIQENDELFSNTHPDLLFQHIKVHRGEGRVQYGLKELATNGLLLDIDYFIIGEIKGDEAKDFIKSSFTGHKCWSTCHGKNEIEGIYKLADYVKQATSYSLDECLRMLVGIDTVVYLENYQVAGISEIKGYDDEKKDLIITKVDIPLPPKRKAGDLM